MSPNQALQPDGRRVAWPAGERALVPCLGLTAILTNYDRIQEKICG